MATLQERIAAAEKRLAETKQASESYASRRQARDRSFIANLVVITFVFLIAVIALVVLFRDWSEVKDPAEFVLKLMSSVLLPVVTLVIGYYFGKSKEGPA